MELRDTILLGDWLELLDRVTNMAYGNLDRISIHDPRCMIVRAGFIERVSARNLAEYRSPKWPHYSYTTKLYGGLVLTMYNGRAESSKIAGNTDIERDEELN